MFVQPTPLDSPAGEAAFRRVQRHASEVIDFDTDTPAPARLTALKRFLKEEREQLVKLQSRGEGGWRVVRVRTLTLDLVLWKLFSLALEKLPEVSGGKAPEICLIALGGYGRSELAPLSDIDVMFLFSKGARGEDLRAAQETFTEHVLYPLWDLGFKVGHSSRTIKEAMTEAASEDKSLNAFLEARLVCGESTLFQEFNQALDRFIRSRDQRPYMRRCLDRREERWHKMGNTVYLQEPDIKTGVGGLRDYQSILWMARMKLGEGSREALVSSGYLSGAEGRELDMAYDYLLRVRNQLHFDSPRPTDLLDLERQPQIAAALGYQHEDIFKRVEAFMRDYYRAAHTVYSTTKLLEQRLAMPYPPGRRPVTFQAALDARRPDRQKLHDGFIFGEGNIFAEHRRVFEEDPLRLIRLFRYVQQQDAGLDPELQALVRASVDLITPEFIRDERANRAFRSLLQETGRVSLALEQMHELRVLGRFLPEFEDLTCLVQHEYYHRYTADIHTLATIRQADRIFSAEDEVARTYRAALKETATPALIYLMLLLHDIGKGVSIRGHAEIGAEMAGPILQRMGVGEEHSKLVAFIIRHHLEMARFWQRFDLDDPRTTAKFAALLGDEERLHFLFALTYCDALGTAESLWNSYKDSLHRQLYAQTVETLHENKETLETRRRERRKMIQEEIRRLIGDELPADQVEAHFNHLPERYFVQHTASEIILHMRMIRRLLENITNADSLNSLSPVINWRDDFDQGMTIVNVVTWDRSGLFFKLAGALTVSGVNILSTKAISRSDHITIDTFYIVEPGAGVVSRPEAKLVFEQYVEAALLENRDLLPEIERQSRAHEGQLRLKRESRLQAPIPAQVDVYHELSLRRTIVEVQATDHLGLLYELAKTIFDHGFDISFARIATERGAAMDTFYIESNDGQTPINTTSLVELKTSLRQIVADERFEAAG
ncbi:MAG: [protein-PII] uridylyltransferase [Opitutales bacterium]